MKVLVTGASGFIGRPLCDRLSRTENVVLVATARSGLRSSVSVPLVLRDVGPDSGWHDLLNSVDVVVHLAAHVHVTRNTGDPGEFRRVNVDGTLNLARQAADHGVKRFVYLSSVKVNGESTDEGDAFSAIDDPAPVGAYAVSKHEAETGLRALLHPHSMEYTIIRAPLVYGPGVKANFYNLMRLVHKGIPLPLAGIDNARSMVALDNLVDLIMTCCEHPRAVNETFMVADGEDVSTPELVTRIGIALNRSARLFRLPRSALLAIATAGGKREQFKKLSESLQVDSGETRSILGWEPIISMKGQLSATARHFLGAAS